MACARLALGLPVTLALAALAGSRAGIPIEEGRSYRVDPATAEVGFELGATMHTVRGSTREVQGELTSVRADAQGYALDGTVRIQAASLDTGNARRDRKMREESLLVSAHPEIVFVPRRLTPDASAPAPTGRAVYALVGDLTVRGVTKAVELRVEVSDGGDRLVVEGATDVLWADFSVPNPSFLVVRVAKRVRVSFHVELIP